MGLNVVYMADEKIVPTGIDALAAKAIIPPPITSANPAPATNKSITFNDFKKVDLRVALVEAAAPVPDTSKLLLLTLKVGEEKRSVVSGIAEFYKPEELVGKKVILVYNLAPRAIRGVESQGMVLAAPGKDGRLALLAPDKDISDGVQIQ
jgi:methionyl-tRNA synthetase